MPNKMTGVNITTLGRYLGNKDLGSCDCCSVCCLLRHELILLPLPRLGMYQESWLIEGGVDISTESTSGLCRIRRASTRYPQPLRKACGNPGCGSDHLTTLGCPAELGEIVALQLAGWKSRPWSPSQHIPVPEMLKQ